MIRHLFCLAMAAGMLMAAPLEAQRLEPGCRRDPVRPEREARDRRRPAERARDSLVAAIRIDLQRDARAAALAAGIAEPTGIFLVSFEKAKPESAQFRAWRSNVPHAVLAGALERALPRLAAWPDREPATLNLRLDSVPPRDTTATHVVACTPILENRAEITDLISDFAEENEEMLGGSGSQATVQVTMLISREGEVAHAEVRRSSGNVRMDGYGVSLAQRMRFRPASIDGQAQDIWVTLPVTAAVR